MNRIYLREHIKKDRASYIAWQTDPVMSKYVSWLPKTNQESNDNFDACLADQRHKQRTNYYLAIVLRESEQVIGDIGILLNDSNTGEIGWFLRQQYWQQGYGIEAAQLMLDYSFKSLGLAAVTASCHEINLASKKIMERCGFQLETQNNDRLFYLLSNH